MQEDLLNQKILLVDDDITLLTLLVEILVKEGFKSIEKRSNGIDAILCTKDFNPDLILLDINLPDVDGYMVCEKIRGFSNCPIIFISAKAEDVDRIQGFVSGGDDYIVKPFNITEVIMRIKAQLKRSLPMKQMQSSIVNIGDLSFDEAKMEIKKKNQVLTLTAKEYQLLSFFMLNPNHVFSKHHLCEAVWDYTYDGNDNTIMVHIRHIREKIEDDASNPKYLITLKGLGYKFIKI